ncbi:hypothetical protein [Chitinasiproducens palmae]|uniref:Uncharacterized protein n=1 Tax=Chitinasiproducens palmae TaxID=1770053 RepID=A0A1H2PSC8_9BURK|nr:hypothetical protein [Chitinasiproducens palmae]SDV49885.1 hypothetical protein SAMN05216551_109216 [Chitinasiproducens palmae]
MTKKTLEECHLIEANRHLDEARKRIAELSAQYERRSPAAGQREDAQRLLHILTECMQTMNKHRALIEREVVAQRPSNEEAGGS